MLLPENFLHLGVRLHMDIRGFLDLINQVLRHRRGKGWAAHEHDHPPRIFGEIHRRLAGGIRPADNIDVFALA